MRVEAASIRGRSTLALTQPAERGAAAACGLLPCCPALEHSKRLQLGPRWPAVRPAPALIERLAVV